PAITADRTINTAIVNRAADPGELYSVLPGDTPVACDAPTNLDDYCNAILQIGGTGSASFGDAGTVWFQVQIVSGEGLMNGDGITGATVQFNTGNIARP